VAAGGPLIPFRGGRIEARSAGPLGVPQPQESLESHTDAFRRQGLSTTEMIQLVWVAVSVFIHSFDSLFLLGPVAILSVASAILTSRTWFPKMAPINSSIPRRRHSTIMCRSSSTFVETIQAQFVSRVTGYLDSTTENPLVVTQNATFRSDFRIFNSDGNKTMEAYVFY
jgi:hypothetical protein